jgi:hypothetical protein
MTTTTNVWARFLIDHSGGLLDYDAVTLKDVGRETVSRAPQIKLEPTEVRFAEILDERLPVRLEVSSPVRERQVVAVPVVQDGA